VEFGLYATVKNRNTDDVSVAYPTPRLSLDGEAVWLTGVSLAPPYTAVTARRRTASQTQSSMTPLWPVDLLYRVRR